MLINSQFQWQILPLLLILAIHGATAMILAERFEARSTTPAPISVIPSQDWDGNDGPWSSFAVQIGNPPQRVKLLVSTALAQTWAVAPEGCDPSDPTSCAQLRGGEYNYTNSTSWVPNLANVSTEIYYLTLESNLGYEGVGRYGFDDITLNFQGGELTLTNQTVAGIATKEYYMGLFGLAPSATNFSSNGKAIPSLMENLRGQGKIPSISWGYTAGNQYRSSQVFGSLTLGGYDTSRFIPNELSIPFATEFDKDLTVQIDSINLDKGESLLSSPITAFLDSSIPYIYLSASDCALFETAFGLIWNETAQLYLVNDTQHTHLQSQNPNITITLGSNSSSTKVNITLPYAAFNLTASYPLVASPTRYFPLQRTNDSSQYTLGRVFFQEAYLIADFERKNFTVAQCKWVDASPNIMAILPPVDSPLGPVHSTEPVKERDAKITGIAVGAAVIIICLFLACMYHCRVRQQKRSAIQIPDTPTRTNRETQGFEFFKPELECSPGGTMICEVESGVKIAEVEDNGMKRYELPAREEVAVEMEGKNKPVEIGGREQRWSWVRGDSRASRFRFGGRDSSEKSEECGDSEKFEESGYSTKCDSEESVKGEGEDTMSTLSSGMGSLADWLVSPQSVEQRLGNLEDYVVSPQVGSPESPELRMQGFGNMF